MTIPTINLKQFDFNKERKTLTAEISQLQLASFPKAFFIESEFTGRRVAFRKNYEDREYDGDLLGIHYQPVEELVNVTDVLIIND